MLEDRYLTTSIVPSGNIDYPRARIEDQKSGLSAEASGLNAIAAVAAAKRELEQKVAALPRPTNVEVDR